MPTVGFEPAFPARKRPQTHGLDRAATGTVPSWLRRGKLLPYSYDYTGNVLVLTDLLSVVDGLDVVLISTCALLLQMAVRSSAVQRLNAERLILCSCLLLCW